MAQPKHQQQGPQRCGTLCARAHASEREELGFRDTMRGKDDGRAHELLAHASADSRATHCTAVLRRRARDK